jgi:hypothetical protein
LGDGDLELLFEEGGQLLLSEGRVLPLLLPQPDSTLRGDFVGMAMAVVDEGLPGGASLTITATELGQVLPAEGEPQFLTQSVKVLPLVEAEQKLLLSQSALDLTDGVPFHGISPSWLRYPHDTTDGTDGQDSRLVRCKWRQAESNQIAFTQDVVVSGILLYRYSG